MSYYEILGISINASDLEIKKAYHKQAIIWHPDKNKDPQAKEKFQSISQAYQVLSNKNSRMHYDLCGEANIETKSPEELFNEVFSNIDPVISKFLKTTFSNLKDKFNSSEKVSIWDLFTTIDRDTLIEEGGNVVKHILKKTLTNSNDDVIDKDHIYELKLDINDIDKENNINLTIDFVRKYTHINIIIPINKSNNTYLLDIAFDEHVIYYLGESYTFFLTDSFPENFKRINDNSLCLHHNVSLKYLDTGYYLDNEFVENERLRLNINFKNKSNIVKVPEKGMLDKKTGKLGDLFIIINYVNCKLDNNYTEKSEVPIYDTISPYILIEKL